MKYYLGVDLGGTNVRVAKVDEKGEIAYVAKSAIDATSGPEVILGFIYQLIRQMPDYQDCAGIGVGVPGPVDTVNGTMTISTNLPGFAGYPLKAAFEKEFGMPAYIDNDANVAGLAEALVGAGAGKPIVYYATVSTGIGGALVVNGQVVSGNKGFAGEIANIIVDRNRPFRDLGTNQGSMESEAGGKALTLRAKEVFGDDKIEHAGNLFDLAKAGDVKAKEMVELMTEDLAVGFTAICHVVDPSVLVIGGGLLKSQDVWFEPFKEKLLARLHVGMRGLSIVTAKLEEPGLVGAAMLPVSF